MQKTIIYITEDDTNWLTGLEYFSNEWQLNYRLVQHKTIEEVLQIPHFPKSEIIAIIVDWELNPDTLYMQSIFESLEKEFPIIPVIAISEYEFQQYSGFSKYINKKTTDPEYLFHSIVTYINFYKNDWLNNKINRIVYYVETINGVNTLLEKKEQLFFNADPIIARENAINWFKVNEKASQIFLHAFTTEPSFEKLIPYESIGNLTIYSAFLEDREIISNLQMEYTMYHINKFRVSGYEQTIRVNDNEVYNVLRGIADVEGQIILR